METKIRKAERTCTNEGQINNFLQEAQTAFLGLVDHSMPYVIPLNFVFKDGIFIFTGQMKEEKSPSYTRIQMPV